MNKSDPGLVPLMHRSAVAQTSARCTDQRKVWTLIAAHGGGQGRLRAAAQGLHIHLDTQGRAHRPAYRSVQGEDPHRSAWRWTDQTQSCCPEAPDAQHGEHSHQRKVRSLTAAHGGGQIRLGAAAQRLHVHLSRIQALLAEQPAARLGPRLAGRQLGQPVRFGGVACTPAGISEASVQQATAHQQELQASVQQATLASWQWRSPPARGFLGAVSPRQLCSRQGSQETVPGGQASTCAAGCGQAHAL